MALLPIPAADSGTTKTPTPRKQFTIWSGSAGSNGTVYTVPKGKSFTGYVYPQIPTTSDYWRFNVNGVRIDISANSTYGTWEPIPVFFGEGDVISNYSSYYHGLTGYEE